MMTGKMEDFIKELSKYGESVIEYSHEEITGEIVQQNVEQDIINLPTTNGVTMTSYNKQTLQTLLQSDAFVNEAIRLLGLNQTPSERRAKNTHLHNDIGFSAAYGRTGTRLFEFVTGINTKTGEKKWAPKSLAHPVANKVFSRYIANHGLNNALELGRKIALVHWRQLESLTTYQPQALPSAEAPKAKKPVETVTICGADIIDKRGKAMKIRFDSKFIWLPLSQVKVNSASGDITLPVWLAKAKDMYVDNLEADLEAVARSGVSFGA
jgi:hypothetical protein